MRITDFICRQQIPQFARFFDRNYVSCPPSCSSLELSKMRANLLAENIRLRDRCFVDLPECFVYNYAKWLMNLSFIVLISFVILKLCL